MNHKITNSEYSILNVLWRSKNNELPATQIIRILEKEKGWKSSTIYTLIYRCMEKGYIEKKSPGFVCKALINKEKKQLEEVDALIHDVFENKLDDFLEVCFTHNEILDGIKLKFKKFIDNIK